MAFTNPAVLVGANNAGKSTVIAALRLATGMLRQGMRLNCPETRVIKSERIGVHPFDPAHYDLQLENLRYEFRQATTAITVTFDNRAQVRAVWPVSDEEPFFHFRSSAGVNLSEARAVRDHFTAIGTIPILSPIDVRESSLGTPWVRQNLSTG